MELTEAENRRIKMTTAGITVFLCVYFVGGLATYSFSQTGTDKSFAPFFHWFLFAHVPDARVSHQYMIRLTAIDGRELSPSIAFERAHGVINAPRSNRARDVIRLMGRAFDEGETGRAAELQRLFEQAFLPVGVEYELVRFTYDTLEHFKTGTFESSEVVVTGNTEP